ncbi:MAG TPA: VCBS repeat-containing protein, partial [Caldisericia bacterium]|nr:VCBS repeat-containing protein [Caldisericia bacterium]
MYKKISSFIILLIVFVAFSMPFSYSQAEESSSIWLEPQKYKVFGLDKSGKIEFEDNNPGIALKEIKEVKDAINISPSWLKDELSKQFYDMFRRPIDIGENATIATGDINGDGYPDIIAGGKNTLTIFINSKTPFTLSLLKLKSIEFPDFANKEINPSLFDMDNDGFCDLIVGVENKVYLLKNEASKETPTFKSPELIFESQAEDSSKENLTP